MNEVVQLVPKAMRDARANLEAFIRKCRDEGPAFGPGLPFDSPAWDITGHIDKKADNTKTSVVFEKLPRNRPRFRVLSNVLSYLDEHPECRLDGGFEAFAKAVFRYLHSTMPRKDFNTRVNALRCIEASLRERTPDALLVDPSQLSYACMNRSLEIAKQQFKVTTACCIAAELENLASFINDMDFVRARFKWWNPLHRRDPGRILGPEADQERERKLPGQEALNEIASIFQTATEPRDQITTAVVAILLSGASRIHELLLRPAEIEVYQGQKDGKPAYGLRWENGKGGGHRRNG